MVATHANGNIVSSNQFAALAGKSSPGPSAPPPASNGHDKAHATKASAKKEQASRAASGLTASGANGSSVGKKAAHSNGDARGMSYSSGSSNGDALEHVNGIANGAAVKGKAKAEEASHELRQRTKTLAKSSKQKAKEVQLSERERIAKIDWEIPRKALHSSIGFLTVGLYHLDPPTLRPLISVLTSGLVAVSAVDYIRLNNPGFARQYERVLGPLMRESEKTKVNGVIWYLVGVIFVLSVYPRDVAVISILTLSWSDTTASTIGRLLGRHSPSLPAHVPLLPFLPFAQRKSLAGFSAAALTGFLIAVGFWWSGSHGGWCVLSAGASIAGQPLGFWLTAVVLGLGGAVVEALDLGYDDNLTLPILTGAIMWAWLRVASLACGGI